MLMSATLGSTARSQWLGRPQPTFETAVAAPYPAVWTARSRPVMSGRRHTGGRVQGLGYFGGWYDGRSAGVWRGVGPIVETDRYPQGAALWKAGLLHLSEAKRLGPTEFPCIITCPDGETGMVHFEQHVFGKYRPYGF